MQNITVLCVGKLKEKFYADACAEYQKRLTRCCKLSLVELSEERLGENPSAAQIEVALEREAAAALSGVDMLLLEANHDVETLQSGPYPYHQKRRILGEQGHLSNEAAAEFALRCAMSGTRDILLAHLSAENNTPAMAEYAVARRLQAAGCSVRLGVAPRDRLSDVHTVEHARYEHARARAAE